MLRGWLVGLAILVGTGCAFAADANSSLAHEKRWEEARKLLAEGNAAEAKVAFEDLLGQYPNEPDLHLFVGITLLRLRDPQAAVTSIKRAIALDPNHVEARTLLGWVESEVRGDFNAAVKEYEKVVELRPNSAEAYNNLGVAEKRKGELDKAAAAFNKALERKPDYGAALSNRGWIFAAENQWGEARRDFEHALKVDPSDDGALYGLSQSLRETRDYAGAQQALSRLISRSPNFVYWLEWGRIGLIRYWWVWLFTALAFFLKARFNKKRSAPNG
ncbi:MAG TPA: tetratricopeptide repeat protein [Methylomirabilota bacterium]|nr:tetratricopeptide repeat protein [Methylomirabilota bacterium]